MKRQRPGEKVKLMSVDELLGVGDEETNISLDIDAIESFAHHPYRVVDDEKMQDLVESIRHNGILTPVIVRPKGENRYEMLSGHRRMHAAKLAGLTQIPAIVRELDDDTATIVMVEANSQREEVLPSEKAFAYRMKYEALRRQGSRSDLTSSQFGTKLRADDALGQEVGESRNQIHRYIRLTELIPEILGMVDGKKIALCTAVDISFLDKPVQKLLFSFMRENGPLKSFQVTAVRKFVEDNGNITAVKLKQLFEDNVRGKSFRKVVLVDQKLKKYFSSNYSPEDMEKIILMLLERWKEEQETKT